MDIRRQEIVAQGRQPLLIRGARLTRLELRELRVEALEAGLHVAVTHGAPRRRLGVDVVLQERSVLLLIPAQRCYAVAVALVAVSWRCGLVAVRLGVGAGSVTLCPRG